MIDLHMHTLYSDGNKTVRELLKRCEERNLEYIAITDHNHCGAYYDDEINNNEFTGKIIKGCELNAKFQNRAIEILGYNINPDIIMKWKEKYYTKEKTQEHTKNIYNRFIEIIKKKGIIINEENIRKQKYEGELIERLIWEEIIKHPENKEILGEENFKIFRIFGRKELTNPESEYFLNRVSTYPTVKEIINIIHQAGGKAFLAHPFEYKFKDTIKFIDDLRLETELDGIECYHPSAEEDNKIEILLDYARRNNLYISGGSDYHGVLKPDIELGIGKGSLEIPKEIINEWL